MLPVCNSRSSVASLLDGLKARIDPATHLRLARLRGRLPLTRGELLASTQWQQSSAALQRAGAPPDLQFGTPS